MRTTRTLACSQATSEDSEERPPTRLLKYNTTDSLRETKCPLLESYLSRIPAADQCHPVNAPPYLSTDSHGASSDLYIGNYKTNRALLQNAWYILTASAPNLATILPSASGTKPLQSTPQTTPDPLVSRLQHLPASEIKRAVNSFEHHTKHSVLS